MQQPRRLAIDLDRAADQVAFDPAATQHHRLGLFASPEQHLDPHRHLGEVERLGQIVVAARAKPRDPLVDIAERAQHQDGDGDMPLPQARDQGQAVQSGQHPVQGDRIKGFTGGKVQTGIAIGGAAGIMAMPLQLGNDRRGGGVVVFNDQDGSHAIDIALHPTRGQASVRQVKFI